MTAALIFFSQDRKGRDSANATSPVYYPSPIQGYNSPDEDYYLIIC